MGNRSYKGNKVLFQELATLEKGSKAYKEKVEELFYKNIGLAVKRASRFNYNNEYKEDILSEAHIGLYKAIINYDLQREKRFSTCAYKYIDIEILKYFFESEKKYKPNTSLSDKINLPDDNGIESTITYGDVTLYDDNIFKDPEKELILKSDKQFLLSILPYLTKDQYNVIKMKFMSGPTVVENKFIAKSLNISRNTVSDRLQNGIKKLSDVYQVISDENYSETRETLKNLIETKLSNNQADILSLLYFAPKLIDKKEAQSKLNLCKNRVDKELKQGLSTLNKLYNEDHENLTKEKMEKILLYRKIEHEN